MTAEYPSGVYSPRIKENRAGEIYDAEKKTIGFVEDVTKLDDEVVAIETELGTDPKGTSISLKERIRGIRSLSDANEDVLVVKEGNVGIGTTAPKNKLDVEGGAVIGATYSGTNTAPSNGLLVQGNVGIGTTAPGAKLEVANGGAMAVIRLTGYTADNSQIEFIATGHSNPFAAIRSQNTSRGVGGLGFFANSANSATLSERMRIDKNGNVGIGTTAPATKLEVKGAITQSELSADPTDPAEGKSVKWQSDGTGSGDDGDIMMKITAGGVTKIVTLVDFSSL